MRKKTAKMIKRMCMDAKMYRTMKKSWNALNHKQREALGKIAKRSDRHA